MSNLARLHAAMADNGHSWALIGDSIMVRWLTGFTGSFGYLLTSEAKTIFITDSRYAIQADEQVKGIEIRWFKSPMRLTTFVKELVAELGISRLGFESEISFASYEGWSKTLEGVELNPLGPWLTELRMIKSDVELAKIKSACELTDACFAHVQRLIQVGVSEYEIQLDIEFYFRKHHAELAFEPIVVSGANSARPHGRATEKPLEVGDFLTMDFGGKLDGYCADLTRTVVVGKASDRHVEIYNQVLKAQLASIAAMKPGAEAKSIDKVARDVLDEKGLSQYFGHGLGHGLGALVHDPGSLGAMSTHVLAVGQVWTVEPGVYIEGFGGVRIEDDVVVTPDGVEVLTTSPKELLVL